MKEEKIDVEIIDYMCGDCGNNAWELRVGHASDGRTLLVVSCANQDCVNEKRTTEGAAPDELMIWDELDITGQGHDPEDMVLKETTNGNLMN